MRASAEQTVIVTGASSGIGEASVRRLVKAGVNTILFARRAERLEQLAQAIDPANQRTLVVPGDLVREEDRERVVRAALERFGALSGLVNNAGYGQRGAIEQVTVADIRRNFETNVFSLLALTQQVVPHLRARGFGRVVNVGSVAGRIARPLTSVYDATKHALEAFTDGLRGELKPFNVHVALIRPGFILTEFVDAADRASAQTLAAPGPYAPFSQSLKGSARRLQRIAGTPDDVARAIEHALLSKYPKSHYAVPAHAKLFLLLKWGLPVRVVDWLVRLKT